MSRLGEESRAMGAGSFVSWIGGGISRAAATGLVIAVILVVFGMSPGELMAYWWSSAPPWIASGYFRLGVLIVGLAIIFVILNFNRWSQKQKSIDSLAEDISWAIEHLTNRPRLDNPSSQEADRDFDIFKSEYDTWIAKVSKKLENRAFFTRADQLHFDRLGYLDNPISLGTSDHRIGWVHTQLALKFERLREVINWSQQRRR